MFFFRPPASKFFRQADENQPIKCHTPGWTNAELHYDVVCVLQASASSFIRFTILGLHGANSAQTVPGTHGEHNAFTRLMASSTALVWPALVAENNGKHRLRNDMINALKTAQIGVTHAHLESFMHLLAALVDCLWVIEPHEHTLAERSCILPELISPSQLR